MDVSDESRDRHARTVVWSVLRLLADPSHPRRVAGRLLSARTHTRPRCAREQMDSEGCPTLMYMDTLHRQLSRRKPSAVKATIAYSALCGSV